MRFSPHTILNLAVLILLEYGRVVNGCASTQGPVSASTTTTTSTSTSSTTTSTTAAATTTTSAAVTTTSTPATSTSSTAATSTSSTAATSTSSTAATSTSSTAAATTTTTGPTTTTTPAACVFSSMLPDNTRFDVNPCGTVVDCSTTACTCTLADSASVLLAASDCFGDLCVTSNSVTTKISAPSTGSVITCSNGVDSISEDGGGSTSPVELIKCPTVPAGLCT